MLHRIKIAAAREDRPPTVAIDLDGTLAKMYDKFDDENIDPPRPGARKAVQEFKDLGWRIIIFTVRGNKKVVADWLTEHRIPYDYINENPDQPAGASDKVVADLYIDDRGMDARKAWSTLKNDVIQRMEKKGEIVYWQQVPALVAQRFKEAASVERKISKIIKHLPSMPGYGYCYWHPEKKKLWIVLGDSDDDHVHQKWHNALKSVNGVKDVTSESEVGPPPDTLDEWIHIKSASALSWLNKPYQLAGLPSDGASPMSNALVSGLLGAGLGYGSGWLAEQFIPQRYADRGRLRRNLAILGGVGGAAMHIPQGIANMSLNRDATGESRPFRSFFGGDDYQTVTPETQNLYNFQRGKAAMHLMRRKCATLPEPQIEFVKAAEDFIKQAIGTGAFGIKPVPVDAFNNAIWNDVHNGANSSQSNPYGTRSHYADNSQNLHTPPVHAAAAAGLVSGVQQMYGNPKLLSPRHFVNGLANAGMDMVTARVAGGVLGALGGLTQPTQQKLQDIGLWSGMIRGVTGSVFGLR